jgi:hypothetical protein
LPVRDMKTYPDAQLEAILGAASNRGLAALVEAV